MHLTKEEEKILQGERGTGQAKAMELLVALGRIYDADRLIPIESAQIAGVSFKTMGDAGLSFIQDFSEIAEVKVRSLLNPAGMDIQEKNYESDRFRKKQLKLIDAYRKMGVEISCTCTPYLAGNRPGLGDHLAWSESSAVSFANSVLGARTNREGGPSALMSAVIGKTPNYGLHLEKNRSPDVIYEVKEDVPLSLLGYLVGEEVENEVPYFTGIKPDEDEMKSLGAAMAATGSVAMYHVDGVTPEAKKFKVSELDKRKVDLEDIKEIREKIMEDIEPDVIAIGCPHLSKKELERLASKLKDKEKRDGPDLLVFTSRKVKEDSKDIVEEIEKFGKVVCDTCMVVSPLEEKYDSVGTDSGKAVSYLPKLAGQKAIYADIDSLVELIS